MVDHVLLLTSVSLPMSCVLPTNVSVHQLTTTVDMMIPVNQVSSYIRYSH